MKSDTTPGPDGFFKKFWPLMKRGVLHILNDFILGRVDIARLNLGVLSLIPKLLEAESIPQYRSIALINMIFKIISKAFSCYLDPQTQGMLYSGWLSGSDGMHELRVKKLGGVLLKLDFEKA
jgi:hypothetical protein